MKLKTLSIPEELIAGAPEDNNKGDKGDHDNKVEKDILHQNYIALPVFPNHPIISLCSGGGRLNLGFKWSQGPIGVVLWW